MDWFLNTALPVAITILAPVLLIVVPVLVVRAMRTPPEKKFRKVYDGIIQHTEPQPGLVSIEFHSYDGFLAWFTQTAHEGFYTPEDARELLRRLVRYNLTWGLFAAGGVFVPFLTFFNYRSQKRSIDRQLDTCSE